MLPTDISEGTDSGPHPQTETTAQSKDVSATGPSLVFDLHEPSDDDQENWLEPLPFSTPGPGSFLGSSVASNNLSLRIPQKHLSTVSYANETYIGSNLPSNRSHIPVYSSDVLPSVPKENLSAVSYANETYTGSNLPSNRSHTPVYSSDVPPSVPKKNLSAVSYANEIYIGSNLPSNRSHTPAYSSDILPSVPQRNLFRVLHATESYISSNLPTNRSHTPVYSSDFLLSDPCFEYFATDEVGSSWKPSLPEEDNQSVFSNIYGTSAPHYSAPRPVHFDSPLEDSMSSDHLHPGYETDYDTIDFHWKPFDRKNLVVSDGLQKPIYASRPVRSNGASDASECEHSVKPVNTETNTLNSDIFPARRPASPLLPISPAPFRFLVPPESDALSSVLKSQDQPAIPKPSTPKNPPYFEVPGVYISPLDKHRKVHHSVSNIVEI